MEAKYRKASKTATMLNEVGVPQGQYNPQRSNPIVFDNARPDSGC